MKEPIWKLQKTLLSYKGKTIKIDKENTRTKKNRITEIQEKRMDSFLQKNTNIHTIIHPFSLEEIKPNCKHDSAHAKRICQNKFSNFYLISFSYKTFADSILISMRVSP